MRGKHLEQQLGDIVATRAPAVSPRRHGPDYPLNLPADLWYLTLKTLVDLTPALLSHSQKI